MFGCDDAVAVWVGQRIGRQIVPPFTAIGWLDRDGKPAGGCVFNNLDASNIDLTFALDKPLTRDVIRAIGHYVFVQLGCSRVTMKTRRSNKRACRAAHKSGFQFETILEGWFGSEDGVQFKMHSSQCRWI